MRRFKYVFQCRRFTLIICAMVLVFGFLVFSGILTREQSAIPADLIDGTDPLTVYRPTDDTDTVYYSVKGESMFTKAGGVADSGKWYGIRVDEYGRVICSPSSVISVPGWTLEGKDSLDLG